VREVARDRPYREAAVVWREANTVPLPSGTRAAIAALVYRYLSQLGRAPSEEDLVRESVDDETFINFFAQHIDVAPLERQALLEAPTLHERARRLIDVLEFGLEELRVLPGSGSQRAH